jgi:hypothetical protein
MTGMSMKKPTLKQIRLLGIGLLMMPPCVVMVASIFQKQAIPPEPTTWLMTAVYWSAGICLFYVGYVVWISRAIRGKMGERLDAKGFDPRAFLLLIAVTTAILPSCLAMLLTPFGFPFRWSLAVAGFSFITLVGCLVAIRPTPDPVGLGEG